MARIVSLPNLGTEGRPKFLNSDDPTLINNFIDAETRAGHGIFDILNPLKPGVTVHGKDNIAAIEFLFLTSTARMSSRAWRKSTHCLPPRCR